MAATGSKVGTRQLGLLFTAAWPNSHRHIRPGGLRSFVYHGSKRKNAANELHDFDVVITTYDTLRSDWDTSGPLYTRTWARIILDEGESNPFSNRCPYSQPSTCYLIQLGKHHPSTILTRSPTAQLTKSATPPPNSSAPPAKPPPATGGVSPARQSRTGSATSAPSSPLSVSRRS
jgi:hypothetical protein